MLSTQKDTYGQVDVLVNGNRCHCSFLEAGPNKIKQTEQHRLAECLCMDLALRGRHCHGQGGNKCSLRSNPRASPKKD